MTVWELILAVAVVSALLGFAGSYLAYRTDIRGAVVALSFLIGAIIAVAIQYADQRHIMPLGTAIPVLFLVYFISWGTARTLGKKVFSSQPTN